MQLSKDAYLNNKKLNAIVVAIIVFIGCVLVSIGVWFATKQQEHTLIQKASLSENNQLVHQFSRSLPNIMSALERMRGRWQHREGTPFDEWQQDSLNYVADFPGLKAVEWVDENYIVRWIAPLAGNEKAQDLDLTFEKNRKQALDKARASQTFTMSQPIDLVQGGKGFLAYFPIFYQSEFNGFVLGVFSIEVLVNSLLDGTIKRHFNIELLSGEQTVYQNIELLAKFDQDTGSQRAFELYGVNWTFKVWPKAHRLKQDYSSIPMAILLNGVVISVLIALIVFYALNVKGIRSYLKAKEAQLSATINNTIDGIITINEKGQILSVNDSAQHIFGYQEAELLNRNVKCLMPEPYHGEHDTYIANYVQTLEAKIIGQGREVSGLRKNGEIFPMELGVTQFSVDNRMYFCGMVRDITVQQKLASEKEKLIKQLSQSNEELDNFAYIASHDLKEPLRAIRNHSTFLKEDYEQVLDEDGVHKLNRLMYLTSRMEKLISDLLYFSRLGREKANREVTDVNLIVEDVKARLEESLEKHNVELVIDNVLPSIACDSVKVTELFHNLVTNAYKYNVADKKRINIGSDNGNPETFYIKDNGIGIDNRFKKDIFRIFKRLNSPKKFGEGSGVGLTFSKKIVEQHNGKIWFESTENQGTCFYFTLREKNGDD